MLVHVRKVLIYLLLIVIAYFAIRQLYFVLIPKVSISNLTENELVEIMIQLPANRIVFSDIKPKTIATIAYTANQNIGSYVYQIEFDNEKVLQGQCGEVKDAEWGKHWQITVHSQNHVSCEDI